MPCAKASCCTSLKRGSSNCTNRWIARYLLPIWPRDTKFGTRRWELLCQAYVKGRYAPHYVIRDVEPEWPVERIELLGKPLN